VETLTESPGGESEKNTSSSKVIYTPGLALDLVCWGDETLPASPTHSLSLASLSPSAGAGAVAELRSCWSNNTVWVFLTIFLGPKSIKFQIFPIVEYLHIPNDISNFTYVSLLPYILPDSKLYNSFSNFVHETKFVDHSWWSWADLLTRDTEWTVCCAPACCLLAIKLGMTLVLKKFPTLKHFRCWVWDFPIGVAKRGRRSGGRGYYKEYSISISSY
jgi:hypothetical protein